MSGHSEIQMKKSVLLGLITMLALAIPALAGEHPVGGPGRAALRRSVRAAPSVRAALEVNGIPISRKTYRRAIKEAEPAWTHLLAMIPAEVLAREGKTKQEFLFLHDHAEPLVMRTRHAAEVAALESSARECYRRAAAGEDMSLLVLKYATDPGAVQTRGDSGLVAFTDIVHPLNRLAWAADVGDILPPVQTVQGYHVLKVTEIIPAREIPAEGERGAQTIPELRRMRQVLLLWNTVHARGNPTFTALREEIEALPSEVKIKVLDDRLCHELPNWCAARPNAWTARPPAEDLAAEAAVEAAPVPVPQR